MTGLDLSDEKVSYALDYRDAYPFVSCFSYWLINQIQYLNNLDSDKKYKQWGNSVKLMLQPYYPGMIRPIARNLFNLVFSAPFIITKTIFRSLWWIPRARRVAV